jgi:hypothetical protein
MPPGQGSSPANSGTTGSTRARSASRNAAASAACTGRGMAAVASRDRAVTLTSASSRPTSARSQTGVAPARGLRVWGAGVPVSGSAALLDADGIGAVGGGVR